MSLTILATALTIAQLALIVSMALSTARIIYGPRAQDRVLALDALYLNSLLLLLTQGMRTGSTFFFDAGLVVAMLGFVATVALAKFLMRGEVIE